MKLKRSGSTAVRGMFSYSCSKCGDKEQFDWADQCVLKVGHLFVRGYYDSYGGVEGAPADKKGKKGATVLAYHEQFRQFFGCWTLSSDCLLATKIYCDGDGNQDSGILLNQSRGNDRMAMLRGMLFEVEDGDGCDRHCAPKRITILGALHHSMLGMLPKAVPADDATKQAKKHVNSGAKDEPKSKEGQERKDLDW